MLKTTTPLREPDLSIRLYKALAECLRERNVPLTYGAAHQLVTDAELLRLHNVGKGTVAEWTAFKAANPVLPEAPDNVITEDDAKTVEALRAEIERLTQWQADAVAQFPDLRACSLLLKARQIVADLWAAEGNNTIAEGTRKGNYDGDIEMRAALAALKSVEAQ